MTNDKKRLRQPENYILTEQDVNGQEQFESFLNHLTDVVASEPIHNIGIKDIGISNQKVMVFIEDFSTPDTYVPIFCNVNVGVELTKNRGIHMSRCIESIFSLSQKKFKTLDEFSIELATLIREKQESESASIEVVGTYLQKRITKKTNLETFDSVKLISKVSVSEKGLRVKTGVIVYNTTACPCTKTYTKYSVVPKLKALGLSLEQIKKIVEITIAGSHMQLGETELTVDNNSSHTTHKQLFDVLDRSTHLVNELLKRPDEHDLVVRALKRPQFTEDVAREVAYNAYETLKDILPVETELYVGSVLKDSIHIHDVYTVIQKMFGEIKEDLQRQLS